MNHLFSGIWPSPSFLKVSNGSVSIPNNTDSLIQVTKNQHIANIRSVATVDILDCSSLEAESLVIKSDPDSHTAHKSLFCEKVSVDPDGQLTVDQREAFQRINQRYNSAFNPTYTGYNLCQWGSACPC